MSRMEEEAGAGSRVRPSSAGPQSPGLSDAAANTAATASSTDASGRADSADGEAERGADDGREHLHLLLPRALSTPMSGDAVSSRLLQALPQLGLAHWILEVNSQGQHGEGPREGDDTATEDSPSPRSDGVTATTHLLPTPRQDWATTSPRSRRRSASSISSSEVSASRLRSLSQVNLRRPDALRVSRTGSGRSDSSAERDASSESRAAGGEAGSTEASEENADSDDQTALDELQALFRRCHHSLPFVALFLVYFAYQHATGILVVVVGTIAIVGLDQRVRAQVALKDKASIFHLIGIIGMCAIDMVALCTVNGEPNPFLHFSRMLEASKNHKGAFWEVVWIVLVNDFMIRLCSLSIKAIVAAIKSDKLFCRVGATPPVSAATSVGESDAAFTGSDPSQSAGSDNSAAPAAPRTSSSAAFYRRKRKLYGIIEMCSIFLRSLLASVPWCSYYQLCSSQFMADVFTFAYLFIKGLVLGTQGRQIFSRIRSFVTLGLEFGTYVTADELVESGSPDCSICYEPMHVPVKLSCSHMFCEECVTEWFDRERSCPLCRASVGPSALDQDDDRPQYLDGSTSLIPQLL